MRDLALHGVVEQGLRELGLIPPASAAEALVHLATLVEEWGRRTNLTGHRDAETVLRRLVLDAAALLGHLPSFETAADLGAGAGFPGLPLAILQPQSHVFLVEARERRHHFQREAIRALHLENVEAQQGRFEELEPVSCDLIIAQAVASPDALVDAMLRWAKPGAWLAVPGGETPRSSSAEGRLSDPQTVAYAVPLGGPRRTVWLARAL